MATATKTPAKKAPAPPAPRPPAPAPAPAPQMAPAPAPASPPIVPPATPPTAPPPLASSAQLNAQQDGTAPAATETTTAKIPKHQADIKPELWNFDEEMVEVPRTRRPIEGKWVKILAALYEFTAAGKVKGTVDGTAFRFTKIGTYTNDNGARTQALAFKKNDDIHAVYEFKPLPKPNGEKGSELWARVRSAETTPDATDTAMDATATATATVDAPA